MSLRSASLHGVLICALAYPLAALMVDAACNSLGPTPTARIVAVTGIWSLRLVLAMLMLKLIENLRQGVIVATLIRLVTIAAIAYALLHGLAYLVMEHSLDPGELVKDLGLNPHLGAGYAAALSMLPAAWWAVVPARRDSASVAGAVQFSSSFAAALAVFHFFWLVRSDVTAPALYAAMLASVLCLQFATRPRRRVRRPQDR